MLICLPGLKSKANITNLLFYSTRQPYKGHPSIPLLPYCIFYKCTDRSVAHTPRRIRVVSLLSALLLQWHNVTVLVLCSLHRKVKPICHH